MKFFILALAFAFMAQSAMAQLLGGYVALTQDEINASPVITDLGNLGAAYVIQQGVFVSRRAPLPGNWYDTNITKIEANVNPGAIDYRYTAILTENNNQATAVAVYVVSWRPSNAAFLVTSYQYTVTKGSAPQEILVGGPSLIDVRPLNAGTSDLFPTLVDSIKYVVYDAANSGQIPGGLYTLRYVYNAYLESSGFPPTYVFLVRLIGSSGTNYRVQITTPVVEEAFGEDHEAEYSHGEDLGEYENQVGEINLGNGSTISYIIFPNE